MIVLSNTTPQIIQPGQSITFDDVVLHSGCGECHRANTGSIKLRANGVYEAHFSANIGVEATPVAAPDAVVNPAPLQLALAIGGEPLPETTMISYPAAANELNNVSTATAIKNCCGDYDRVTVINTGTEAVVIGANPALFIKRVS